MKKIIVIFFIFISAFMYTGKIICYAASGANSIKAGNGMYKKGKFDEALKYYNKAKIDAPSEPIVDFNIGTALYKKKEYKKAIDSFTSALPSAGSGLESRINYNIANAKYRLGRKSVNTDLQKAINLYRQALDYYKRAIDLNHRDMNAKYNHEFVEKELKILLDKLKHQKSSKTSSKGKNSSQNKTNGQKKKTSSSGNKRKENTQPASGQEHKKEAEKEKANTDKMQKFQVNKSESAGSKKEMSEKEARMILNRYSEEELSRGAVNKAKMLEYPPVDKGW